jgi:hypothetical protein
MNLISFSGNNQKNSILSSSIFLNSLKKQVKILINSDLANFICDTGNIKKISYIFRKTLIVCTIINPSTSSAVKNSISALQFFETVLGFHGSYRDIQFWISFNRSSSKEKQPALITIALGCFTLTGIGDNLLALHHLGVSNLLGLSKHASKVGAICPILLKITQEDIETQLKNINIVGMTIILGYSTFRVVEGLNKYYYAIDDQEKNRALSQCSKEGLKFISTAIDLSSIIIPLAVPCGPLVLIGLGIASKGTGLLTKFVEMTKEWNHYVDVKSDEEKNKALSQCKKDALKCTRIATDLALVVIPLAVTCGPIILIAFGVASKGTGLLTKFLATKM